MSLYTVEVRDNFGRLVTVINRPMNKQFTLYRNKPGSLQFTMSLYDPQATYQNLALNQYDVVFRRKGTPIAFGQISYIHPNIDIDKYEVDVIATGYFDLLSTRQVNPYFPNYDTIKNQLVFNSVDGGSVIDSLIQYTQFPLESDGTVLMQGASPTMNESFIAPGTTSVTQIQLMLQAIGSPTGNLVVGIYANNPVNNTPSASLVPNSQISVPVSGIGSGLTWIAANYSNQPALVSGQVYWIKAYLDTAQSGGNGVNIAYLNSGYYFNGRAYSPESPGLFTLGQNLQFFILLSDNSYQMTKNTYLGFLKGNVTTSFDITRTFNKYKIIKDAVDEVTKTKGGVDFNITVSIDPNTNYMTKTYNVFYPGQGINNTMLPFNFPGNIKKIDKPRDGKSMFNFITERGQGSTALQPFTTSFDATSIQVYGLREDAEDSSDISDTPTLQLLGDELVRVRKDPLDVPEIVLDGQQEPPLGSYGVGDTILINISTGNANNVANILQTYRIEQIEVTVDDDDREEIKLGVSSA